MMKKRSEWLAATTPLKAEKDCSICSKIPAHCSRFEKGGDLISDTIPDDVKRLEGLLDSSEVGWRGDVMRCPECHRPYFYESEYEFLIGGSEDTWTYRRCDPEELFHDDWFTRYRVGGKNVDRASSSDAFPHHVIVKLRDGGWIALGDEGERTALASSADLIALEPQGLSDERIARMYLGLYMRLDGVEMPFAIKNFNHISWKWTLTDDEKHQIEDLRAASRVRDEEVERLADRVLVKHWIVSERRLVHRIYTVFPDGKIRIEDAVIGENLPLNV